MSYDYDALYKTTPNALGAPTAEIAAFFRNLSGPLLKVLDIGCGQGRDAVFIARLGHTVLGVDLSQAGIRDLRAAAKTEGLPIIGVVADMTDYAPEERFDVVLIDRTLHMLGRAERLAVLDRVLHGVADQGWCLIADEPSNIPDFRDCVAAHPSQWENVWARKGFLFLRRV